MYNAKIVTIGKYIPHKSVTNDELSLFLDTSDEWIVTRTGIKERKISVSENTSTLCSNAARGIMKNAGISPTDIDGIIVATITPDYMTPSTACIIQGEIGASNAFAFDINAACSGFVYALSVAEKLIKSGAYKNILVIGGEVLSKMTDWKDRRTAVLFGDGAAGVLLSRSESSFILSENLCADGTKYSALVGGHFPVSHTFSKETNQKDTYLSMDGRTILDFALKSVPDSINNVLEKVNLTLADIKYIVPHQANYRIVTAVAKKLKTSIDKFYMNIDKYGNTSAASIPIALSEMLENGLIHIGSGEKIIITGFGGGLTWGSLLIQI